MIFALRRDLIPVATEPVAMTAAECALDEGTSKDIGVLFPGEVRLRDCKRPRPMVLRANDRDLLVVGVENLLRPEVPGHSENFCRPGALTTDPLTAEVRAALSEGDDAAVARHEVACRSGSASQLPGVADPTGGEWPRTRLLNFAIQGLVAIPDPNATDMVQADADLRVCRGLTAIAPGAHVTCFFLVDGVGSYFLSSNAAPAGGEGDGGSITHGLFGAVVVQDAGSEWYRSQVSQAAMDRSWAPVEPDLATRMLTGDHRRSSLVDYDAASNGMPVLNIAKANDGAAREIVHSDLNAIVSQPGGPSFREFSVFFHDELKTFYTKNFEELGKFGQLAGVRDGFAINYGASGMGALLLANRKGFGPASDCVECLYEEFFLTSWANGDPALLERFADDPSNVHHSYLNDEIRFRNFHAGPKETHVFHLHAHQWFSGDDRNRGTYLDSQTVAPQQSFSYRIYGGGLDNHGSPLNNPWLADIGSGNRNRGIGDSIFHCHLYPHFAQGMWELWRVHDVIEDGTRKLPDGQADAKLSTEARALPPDSAAIKRGKRIGSVDPENGRWIAAAEGTPVPALVPLPDKPLPVLPTYADANAEPYLTADAAAAIPGYPFYVAGVPGHRPPQAPMDIARALRDETTAADPVAADEYLDAGLPRHTVLAGERKSGVSSPPGTSPNQQIAKALAMGDLTAHLESANLRLLDYEGTPLERAAMGFHYDGKRWGDTTPIAVQRSDGTPAPFNALGGYEVADPQTNATVPTLFTVNGSAPKPGAPFADPCGAPAALSQDALRRDPLVSWNAVADFRPDPGVASFRRYEASAVQLDLITNRAGWHDPQARINVLTERSDGYKNTNTPLGVDAISPFISAREEPFFFRAFSTECIEFRHTNELPKELDLDDFQVRTPTDTIGQHIHLVKFDVTASDGSGNGFNYEDGTLAADEIAARICAAKTEDKASVTASRPPRALQVREAAGLCEQVIVDGREMWVPARKDIWRLKRSEHPALFQTTVQRWFADPILSRTGDGSETADRTLRTVFSHDHFGPSSIQQHGFYTALIVEPAENSICLPGMTNCRTIADLDTVSDGDEVTVGVHRVLKGAEAAAAGMPPSPALGETLHPDTREYALAVADFAVLYDPRDSDSSVDAIMASGETKGLARLACEARHRGSHSQLEARCGSAFATVDGVVTDAAEDAVPAWNAAGRPGGAGSGSDAMTTAEAQAVADHLGDYRTRAALSTGGKLARPVAAPARPESISVDHHDPYLVNYRGEPMPLRLASKDRMTSSDCSLMQMPMPGTPTGAESDAALVTGARPCSYALQRTGEAGEMSNVFLSSLHGDPATPLIETFAGERTLIRLIQGAQEVQHVFNIEGYTFRRNLDQAFARAAVPATGTPKTQKQRCDALKAATAGYPLYYRQWFEDSLPAAVAVPVKTFFGRLDAAARSCLNIEGNVAAQEIGISEHFEFAGVFQQTFKSATLSAAAPFAPPTSPVSTAPDRRRFSTDYLWDFGTQDALWNGAWGLLRVYLDEQAPDLTTCMRAAPGGDPAACLAQASIGARLTPLPPRVSGGRSLAVATPKPPETLALACDPEAPRAEAAVAAIEARRIFGANGLTFGKSSYDPDALLLLALEPDGLDARLAAPNARALLEQELKARFATDPVEPYVLPVRAGECVTLTMVNLLTTPLPDDFGDARLPAITPLNTSPAQTLVSAAQGRQPQISMLEMEPGQSWRNGITPSSRLALRFPLPVMNENQSLAMPFGFNATGALMPSGATLTLADGIAVPGKGGFVRRDATVERVTFYAGKISAKSVSSTVLQNAVIVALNERFDDPAIPPNLAAIGAQLDINSLSLRELPRERFKPGAISISGRQYDLSPSPASLTDAQRGSLAALVTEVATTVLAGPDYAHWVPYAFGALPIKPYGDVIGQPAHGLVGAILVLPADAAMDGVDKATNAPRLVQPRATPAGQAVAYQQEKICGDGAACPHYVTTSVRNFVLFYQDGLNLWDRGSSIRWTRKDGSPVVAPDRLKMQPDCPICDDSYDRGDRALSYHAAPLYARMRTDPGSRLEADSNLNALAFPSGFWLLQDGEPAAGPAGVGPAKAATSMPVLRAKKGEEVVISVVEPGGRARQHAVVTIAQNYNDLFPGFGFPNSALMAPGKAVNASLSAPVEPGCYLIHDGPTYLRADGIWALLDVVKPEDYDDASKTECKQQP